ncbi:hypothetical protein [Mycobacterium hubeiense]|uniref:hypothetical protein n=1 Tax=Mycobacterium hubeiense TaxID=1867256 RepID=UPI00115971C7|nr:hypothetical protein [Mycobacterium sp. QGD 101]
MKSGEPTKKCAITIAALTALTISAPTAAADPVVPSPPPPDITHHAAQSPPGPPAPPLEGVPHLPSPENLPPGTSDTPTEPAESRGLSYLRDLWHAYQTQEISGADALLLLTQRPLDPNAAPPPGVPAGPQPPAQPAQPAPPPPPAP